MYQRHAKALCLCLWMLGGASGLGCGSDGAPPTSVGQAIWNSDVTTLILEQRGGGFVPPAPTGSTCQLGSGRYTLTPATRDLSWTRCTGDYKSMKPYTQVTGQRTLSVPELKDLSGALEKLKVVANENLCGADKPTQEATVITARGAQVYGDSFYSCSIKDRPLLDSGALSQALSSIAALAQ